MSRQIGMKIWILSSVMQRRRVSIALTSSTQCITRIHMPNTNLSTNSAERTLGTVGDSETSGSFTLCYECVGWPLVMFSVTEMTRVCERPISLGRVAVDQLVDSTW